MQLRPATVADLPAIDDIFNHYVRTSPCIYALEPLPAAERAAWFAQHDAAHPVLVVEAAGAVIGWGALSSYNSRGGYRFTVEDSLFVHPEHQRRGLGRLLLEALVREAKAIGHHAILAVIDAEHEASVALHRAFGFEPVAHLKEVGFKFDRWRDVVFLQRLCDQQK